jgi:hypothetical protein
MNNKKRIKASSLYSSRKRISNTSSHLQSKNTQKSESDKLLSYEVPRKGNILENINRSLQLDPNSFSQPSIGMVQTKLTVGSPTDQYEQEADQVASQVVQQINIPQNQTSIQRNENPEEEEMVQGKFDSIQRETMPEEEEMVQGKFDSIQRETMPEEEEMVQGKFDSIQRETMPEEEEMVQGKFDSIQREIMPEEEEMLQGKFDYIQREIMPEEEEMLQGKFDYIQREIMPEEEEMLQGKFDYIQRETMPEEEEIAQAKLIQKRNNSEQGQVSENIETSIQQVRGNGQALDDNLQQQMGHAMGADFSGVKVHTDSQSDQLNRSIQAKAFTTGKDIFFRQGEYNPSSRDGQELIAHELTHTIQQTGGQKIQPEKES